MTTTLKKDFTEMYKNAKSKEEFTKMLNAFSISHVISHHDKSKRDRLAVGLPTSTPAIGFYRLFPTDAYDTAKKVAILNQTIDGDKWKHTPLYISSKLPLAASDLRMWQGHVLTKNGIIVPRHILELFAKHRVSVVANKEKSFNIEIDGLNPDQMANKFTMFVLEYCLKFNANFSLNLVQLQPAELIAYNDRISTKTFRQSPVSSVIKYIHSESMQKSEKIAASDVNVQECLPYYDGHRIYIIIHLDSCTLVHIIGVHSGSRAEYLPEMFATPKTAPSMESIPYPYNIFGEKLVDKLRPFVISVNDDDTRITMHSKHDKSNVVINLVKSRWMKYIDVGHICRLCDGIKISEPYVLLNITNKMYASFERNQHEFTFKINNSNPMMCLLYTILSMARYKDVVKNDTETAMKLILTRKVFVPGEIKEIIDSDPRKDEMLALVALSNVKVSREDASLQLEYDNELARQRERRAAAAAAKAAAIDKPLSQPGPSHRAVLPRDIVKEQTPEEIAKKQAFEADRGLRQQIWERNRLAQQEEKQRRREATAAAHAKAVRLRHDKETLNSYAPPVCDGLDKWAGRVADIGNVSIALDSLALQANDDDTATVADDGISVIASECPTELVPINPSDHSGLRQYQRSITDIDVQRALKYGVLIHTSMNGKRVIEYENKQFVFAPESNNKLVTVIDLSK